MTPEEGFTGKKTSVDHLQKFGCLVYIQIPKGKRKKMDPTAYKRSKDIPVNFDKEEIPIFWDILRNNNGKDPTSTQEDVEGLSEPKQQVIVPKICKKPSWLRKNLQEAEGHTTKGTFRESKRLKRYYGYVAYITKLIEVEPSSYEDVAKHQEWTNAMQEEYRSIMKNDA
eukprot:PITA_29049